MTKVFTWTPALASGAELIDEQHRELITLANMLLSAIDEGKGEGVVVAALAALQKYTHEHFADEEAYFRQINSPMLDAHIKEHDTLREEVEDFVADEELGFVDLGEDLAHWVETRLVPHMIEMDQKTVEAAHNA